jgi:hypothetical protein
MRKATLILVAFLFSAVAHAQSVDIGSIKLTFGMSENAVLNKLGDEFSLEKGKCKLPCWAFHGKKAPLSIELPTSGFVDFDEGKLVSVSKEWNGIHGELDLATLIYLAMADIQLRGGDSCSISNGKGVGNPNYEAFTSEMLCGGGSFRIETVHDNQTRRTYVNFAETIEKT